MKCTFEKRGLHLRIWVEPVENPNPGQEPRVVELRLSLTNIMHGKEVKGHYAVYSKYPCACCSPTISTRYILTYFRPLFVLDVGSLEYTIERFDAPQDQILARRMKAYRRQERIAFSHPAASTNEKVDATLIAEAISSPEQSSVAHTIDGSSRGESKPQAGL